jgi:hypothetical protein
MNHTTIPGPPWGSWDDVWFPLSPRPMYGSVSGADVMLRPTWLPPEDSCILGRPGDRRMHALIPDAPLARRHRCLV